MLKSIRSVVIWTGTVGLFSGVASYAQVAEPFKKAELTTEITQDPFDFIQEIAENSARNQQDQRLGNIAQYSSKSKFGGSLKYHKKGSGSPEQAQTIYNALVQKYGPPKSVRGQSHVWDIENPSKSSTQADMVTVILRMEASGAYELIMDRDRGENGRASWDATRIKKANAKANAKLVQQRKIKPLLFVQENND